MWYGAIFILLAAYLLEAGGAGYCAARKDWIKGLKQSFGALIYFISIVFIIIYLI